MLAAGAVHVDVLIHIAIAILLEGYTAEAFVLTADLKLTLQILILVIKITINPRKKQIDFYSTLPNLENLAKPPWQNTEKPV